MSIASPQPHWLKPIEPESTDRFFLRLLQRVSSTGEISGLHSSLPRHVIVTKFGRKSSTTGRQNYGNQENCIPRATEPRADEIKGALFVENSDDDVKRVNLIGWLEQ